MAQKDGRYLVGMEILRFGYKKEKLSSSLNLDNDLRILTLSDYKVKIALDSRQIHG